MHGMFLQDVLWPAAHTRSLLFCVPQRDNIWGPFLIISPASTLNNWHQEFSRFVPKFKVSVHGAAGRARRRKHLQSPAPGNPEKTRAALSTSGSATTYTYSHAQWFTRYITWNHQLCEGVNKNINDMIYIMTLSNDELTSLRSVPVVSSRGQCGAASHSNPVINEPTEWLSSFLAPSPGP